MLKSRHSKTERGGKKQVQIEKWIAYRLLLLNREDESTRIQLERNYNKL